MKKQLRKMDVSDYKKIITEMLGYVHKICVENNIHYFVAYGTLIGAIRHDGFIPWDDDLDIWMWGEDYDRFIEILTKSTSDYYILNADNSPNYYHQMTRICAKAGISKLKGIVDIDNLGPFIDIYVIYKAPEDPDERLKLYSSIRAANLDVKYSLPLRYYKTLTLKGKIKSALQILKRLKKRHSIGTKKLKEIRKKMVTQYENTDSDLYYVAFDSKKTTDQYRLYTRKQIEEVEIHKFENIEVLIPSAYDEILTRIYGDYMELPPVEKQVTKHHFTPYWREDE